MSIQNINEYLKEGCGIIASIQPPKTGFNRLVIKKSVIGSETTEVSLPLHESITFHTARKTFITNSIMLGVNITISQAKAKAKLLTLFIHLQTHSLYRKYFNEPKSYL
jgi:hypothetical protein